MNRRSFHRQGVALMAAPMAAGARSPSGDLSAAFWESLERRAHGRLGVAVLDARAGNLIGHRLDERFPMCSTFKWFAAALALHRVDAGQERLDRLIRYGADRLLPHSPITAKHVGVGMTLGALCRATTTVSDNTAANLILESFGGPAAVTAYARRLGDTATRLDRWEPELNEAVPGDPRDTTTPQAMAMLLKATTAGDALTPDSRAQLIEWLQATRTNAARLGAHVPAGWQLGSKTGSGPRGTANDVGVYWTPWRAATIVTVYLTESAASAALRDSVIADAGRAVISWLSSTR
jgi:beta-lactamase class A